MTSFGADERGTLSRAYSCPGSGTAREPANAVVSAGPSRRSDAVMTRTLWTWARLLGGAAILVVLLWRLGTGPFLNAVRMIDGWSLAAAAGIAVLTTVCCAWRWSLVARGLGVDVPLPAAVPAYYPVAVPQRDAARRGARRRAPRCAPRPRRRRCRQAPARRRL